MTATDMERLEQAARLSMGGIPDEEMSAVPPRHLHYFRVIGLALVAVAVLGIALNLF